MRTVLLPLLLPILALILSFASTAHGAERKYALVVGVEDYDPTFFNRLRFAEDDAIGLGRALTDLGFRVTTMSNSSRIPARKPSNAEKILTQLKAVAARTTADDTLVVSLSGHGVMFKKQPPLPDGSRESYFCPQEANLNKLESLVPISKVMKVIQEARAGRKLLIVDACRNEAESDLFKSTNLGAIGLRPRTVPKGMLAIYSCADKEKSVEHPDLKHGVFTYHLLKYLKGEADDRLYPRERISLIEMANYARRETNDFVYRKLNADQSPSLVSSTGVTDWPLGRRLKQLITNSIGMKLQRIPAGEFMMGNEDTVAELMKLFPYARESWFADAANQHRVEISRAFYLGQHEVTVGDFRQFVSSTKYKTDAETDEKGGWGFDVVNRDFSQDKKYNWLDPGFAQTDEHPVVNVSWNDAVAFCKWLSKKDGRNYRLPIEAEWEYACRGGTTTRYWSGNDPQSLARVGNVADGSLNEKVSFLNCIATKDGFVTTAPVGRFHANPFGLYDMHGNVWEWCQDRYSADYYQASPSIDPQGPSKGSARVLRGGGWINGASDCRSAIRRGNSPGLRINDLGFRVALVPAR